MDSQNTPTEENHGKIKLMKPWDKLRKILMSNDRLLFLTDFSTIELNLFNKTVYNEKVMKIVYESPKEIFKTRISKFEKIEIIKPVTTLTKSELLKFYQEKIDNTGNLQLWPCEEILTLYCLFNEKKFYYKRIIELGAGFSGFCSLSIKKSIDGLGEIYITDGNTKCVEALETNVSLNFKDHSDILCKVLVWDAEADNTYGKFDYVLMSDCLFFKNYHIDLVITITKLLKPNGECIIVAPPRGDSMDIFLSIAEKYFDVMKNTEEIGFIKLTKLDTDKYNPYFIKLTLKK